MRVARLADYKKFEFSNSDIIEPNDGQCLLKVKVVSVCGTDIRRGLEIVCYKPERKHVNFLFNQLLAAMLLICFF